jgi:hypothetical protein
MTLGVMTIRKRILSIMTKEKMILSLITLRIKTLKNDTQYKDNRIMTPS